MIRALFLPIIATPIVVPILKAKIIGLKATIGLLIFMLIKSNLLRVKMSLLGSLLGLFFLSLFLVTTGLLTTVAFCTSYNTYKKTNFSS